MLEELKIQLEVAASRLDDLVEKTEDKFKDEFKELGEETGELWQKTRNKMHTLRERLHEASDKTLSSIDSKTDEAELQAHLAAMDVRDQWLEVSGLLSQFSNSAKKEVGAELDHARVQAHLAKLDAQDFMGEKGEAITTDFRKSKMKVQQASMKAATELSEQFDGVLRALPK